MLTNGSSSQPDLDGLEPNEWVVNPRTGILSLTEEALKRLINPDPIEKYYIVDPDPIARGQFAAVYRCLHRVTGDEYAAKFSTKWRLGADCKADIVHEIAVCALLRKAHRVVRLVDVFSTDSELVLVMEYAPGGDLQTLLDEDLVPYERNVIGFLRQLLEGLVYIHDRNIVHLDIKPQNLVLMGDFPDCSLKLCDFEISRMLTTGHEVREILGTADYVAPEIIHYEPITTKTDMWSFGVLTYVLLTGFLPFGGDTDQETFLEITRGELDFPEELFEDISEQAIDFIKRLLIRQPTLRMSAKECLEHEWMQADLKMPKLSQQNQYVGNISSSTASSPPVNSNVTPSAAVYNTNYYTSNSSNSNLALQSSHGSHQPQSNLNDMEFSLEKAFEILERGSCIYPTHKISSPVNITPTIRTPINSSPRETGLPPLYPYMSPRICPSNHSSTSSLNRGASRQSLERLRSISKSREVLAERLQLSSQRKALSKSRERLYDGRYGLHRSRDTLFDQNGFSQSVETLPPFDWLTNDGYMYNSNNSINMPVLPIISLLPTLNNDNINNRLLKSMASVDRLNEAGSLSRCSPYDHHHFLHSRFTSYDDKIVPSYNAGVNVKTTTQRKPSSERPDDRHRERNKNRLTEKRNRKTAPVKKNTGKILSRSRTEPSKSNSISKDSITEKPKKDQQKRRKEKENRGKLNRTEEQRNFSEKTPTKMKDHSILNSSADKVRGSVSHIEQRIQQRHERMMEKQEALEKNRRKSLNVTKTGQHSNINRRYSMNDSMRPSHGNSINRNNNKSNNKNVKNSTSKNCNYSNRNNINYNNNNTTKYGNGNSNRNYINNERPYSSTISNNKSKSSRKNTRSRDTKRQQNIPEVKTEKMKACEPLSCTDETSSSSMESVKECNNNIKKSGSSYGSSLPNHCRSHINSGHKDEIKVRNEKICLSSPVAKSDTMRSRKEFQTARESQQALEDSCDDGIFSRSNSMESNTSVDSSRTVRAAELQKSSSLGCLDRTLEKLKLMEENEKNKNPRNTLPCKNIQITITSPSSFPDTEITLAKETKPATTDFVVSEPPKADSLTVIREEEETSSPVPSYGRSLSSNSSDIGSMFSEASEAPSTDEAFKYLKCSTEVGKITSGLRSGAHSIHEEPPKPLSPFKLSRSNTIHLDTPLMGKPRPWGEVCNGSVSRAFQMFSQKSLDISVVGRKSSDPTSNRP